MSRRPRPSENFECLDEMDYSFEIEREEIENFYVAKRLDAAADEDAAKKRKAAEKPKTTGEGFDGIQWVKIIEQCPDGFRALLRVHPSDIYTEPPNEAAPSTDQSERVADDAINIDGAKGDQK